MAFWIDELLAFAVAQGIGTLGTNLFPFEFTPSPDAQVQIAPYGGLPSEYGFGSDVIRWEHPAAQVITRAAKGDKRAAWVKAMAAYDAFSRVQAEALSGTFWHSVIPKQPPFWLGVDASERPMFVFNLQIEKER